MVEKENTVPLEDAIQGVEDKIKKSSDSYYKKIVENLRQIQREMKGDNIKDGSKKTESHAIYQIKEGY